MEEKTTIKQVRRRSGELVHFDRKKIQSVLYRAFVEVLRDEAESEQRANELADRIIPLLRERFGEVPSVEEIQDVVEEVLIKEGFAQVARAYILYRRRHQEIREIKSWMGVRDELKLPVNAVRVLQRRYLRKDEQGRIIESPAQMFRRVARAVAEAERQYGSGSRVKFFEEEFYTLMASRLFMPNSPTLMNAGTQMGQLSACFVIPVEDSIESIFDAVKNMALIHQSGGGTGFSFSRLRPRGDMVMSTMGIASGPVSFMEIFDTATGVVKQGGRRRGANMGILRIDHPDIIDFITAKGEEGKFRNFNLSVAASDDYMQALEAGRDYPLINPRNGQEVRRVPAGEIFDLIAHMAWKSGDPGMIFLDTINRANPTPELGQIEATNPCGELPLLPYESCNLASINLARLVRGKEIDWEQMTKIVHLGVRFLDDIIEINRFPLPEIEKITKANRKIGLGVMGFADLLFELGIPYDSDQAVEMAERIMRHIQEEAWNQSRLLARERGAFPNFPASVYARRGEAAVRNATTTTVAPTGTISIIAGCSSGIEPVFALSFIRNIMDGTKLTEVNPVFEKVAKERGFFSQELMGQIARLGSIKQLLELPEDVRRVFVTALDIAPEWHLKIQAAFQKYTDNSVSKTINLPAEATVDEVKKIYRQAYHLGCKGITIYRYGSKPDQVLSLPGQYKEKVEEEAWYTTAEAEYSGGCPTSPGCSL
ncbi:MAG: vitamin B12-dependent ribonucleotide reductase [bacterium]|nr:vitamin B12-dependent ribonucleotide reductase [bacterium]